MHVHGDINTKVPMCVVPLPGARGDPGAPGMVGAILATVLLGQFGFVVRDLRSMFGPVVNFCEGRK